MMTPADPDFFASTITVALGGTVSISYFWLACRKRTGDEEVDTAIHLSAGIFWCTIAYTLRPAYWTLHVLGLLPEVARSHAGWLDTIDHFIFIYGAYRAHKAIYLLLPPEKRKNRGPWLAWTGMMSVPRTVRSCLKVLGRALKRMIGRPVQERRRGLPDPRGPGAPDRRQHRTDDPVD